MEPETKSPAIVATFEIPDELAQELSDLMTRQAIREQLLLQQTNDPQKFQEIEDLLVPIVEKINAIKNRITTEYVPDQFRFPRFSWNYSGWAISNHMVEILDNQQMV